jgi:hypothetical protein
MQEFSDEIEINGTKLYRAGCVNKVNDVEAVGAAAYFSEVDCKLRAKSECFERTTVLNSFPVLNVEGENTRFSVTNGVAAHPDQKVATASAFNELLERDLILKSWAGHFKVSQIQNVICNQLAFLEASYDIQFLNIKNSACVVVCLPKHEEPLIIASALEVSLDLAVQKAQREVIQKVAFLWEESFAKDAPAVYPSPQFHLDWSTAKASRAIIEEWISDSSQFQEPLDFEAIHKNTKFKTLTEPNSESELWVIKAENEDLWPLHFGEWPKASQHQVIIKNRSIHPFS